MRPQRGAAVGSKYVGRAAVGGEMAAFGHWRARQFLELARQFDETGSREIDAFLRFIPAQEQAESAAGRPTD